MVALFQQHHGTVGSNLRGLNGAGPYKELLHVHDCLLSTNAIVVGHHCDADNEDDEKDFTKGIHSSSPSCSTR